MYSIYIEKPTERELNFFAEDCNDYYNAEENIVKTDAVLYRFCVGYSIINKLLNKEMLAKKGRLIYPNRSLEDHIKYFGINEDIDSINQKIKKLLEATDLEDKDFRKLKIKLFGMVKPDPYNWGI